MEVDRVKLLSVLTKRFNKEELINLCFDLGIDYDHFSSAGSTLREFALEFIVFIERRLLYEQLVAVILSERPDIDIRLFVTSGYENYQFVDKNLETGKLEILAEAKLVIVGDGNVGKTSLVNRLVDGIFDPNEGTTRGVAITKWDLALPCLENQIGRINIWDFGGQGNMHATHPYFFSRKAVYLVVLNVREDERLNRAEYWLKMIQTYSENSSVIIVANKTDQFSAALDRRTLQNKYPQIAGFARTSCRDSVGISELETEISKAVCLLEDINVRTSHSLVSIKQKLEEMTDPHSEIFRETLDLTEYENLCDESGVDADLRIPYLRRLSDLGVMLYFGDDPRLGLNVVLNPFWVTEGVYTIINHDSLADQNGVLTITQIPQILPRERYALDKGVYILEMMRKFELCFALDESQSTFLLPDLLSPQQPELPEFDQSDALQFHYEYPIWQQSSLTRLIVRLHHYLIENAYWRNGMMLVSSNKKNKAFIIGDEVDRRLKIYIDGEIGTRRHFLNRIREELNVIHGIQQSHNIQEWIIINDAGQVSYRLLEKLEKIGRTEHDIEVADDLITINIKEVLDGVRANKIPDSYRLKELMLEALSYDQIDDLCFKFKISIDDIEGEEIRDAKARNLIRLFERTRRMPELMSVLRELRPEYTWE